MNIIEDQVGSPLAASHGSHPYLRPETLTLTWQRDRGSSPEWRRAAGGPSATNGIPPVRATPNICAQASGIAGSE